MSCDVNEIVVELEIAQAKSVVWDKMLNHIEKWWPRDFLCLGETAVLHFEPFAGGRLYETTPEGASILWGQVVMVVPGESLDMIGAVVPAFGGPNFSMSRMSLTEGESGTTKFRLSNSILGRFSSEGKEDVTQGWAYLYGCFKTYCES